MPITAKEELRAFRIERYEDLRFTLREAETLADAKGDDGTALDWHRVKKMIDQGCSHRLAVRIFAPLDPPKVEEDTGDVV
jgi:hypothetical protein